MVDSCRVQNVRIMGLKIWLTRAGAVRALALATGLGLLAACGVPPDPNGIHDPHEAANRRVHEFNRSLDRALIGPAAHGLGEVIPKPMKRGISNLSDTLDLPGDIVNNLLQLRLEHRADA